MKDVIREVVAALSLPDLPEPPRKNRSKPRPQYTAKERIEMALAKDEIRSRRVGEGIIKTTGQLCYDFPWASAAPRPWSEGYTRVMIPLKEPTRKGRYCLVQIVRNSNLSHGKHS